MFCSRIEGGYLGMIAFYPRDSYLLVDTLHQGYATERLEEQNTNQYNYMLEIRLKLPFL